MGLKGRHREIPVVDGRVLVAGMRFLKNGKGYRMGRQVKLDMMHF